MTTAFQLTYRYDSASYTTYSVHSACD